MREVSEVEKRGVLKRDRDEAGSENGVEKTMKSSNVESAVAEPNHRQEP